MITLATSDDFKKLIPALRSDEYSALENSILAEGCRDAIVHWQGVIVDGHNRFEICQKHGISFNAYELEFESSAHAKIWMIKNQSARRNLTPAQRDLLALAYQDELKIIAKQNMIAGGGDRKSEEYQSGSKNSLTPIEPLRDTAIVAAGKFQTSHDSMRKTKIVMENAPEEIKNALLSGEMSRNEAFKKTNAIQRKKKQREKEKAALETITYTKLWTITADQNVIQCNTLITDPPYAILDEEWDRIENLEAFTRDWLTRWNECGADFVLSFWSQRYLFEGRHWFDESLTNYKFQQLLIWHYPNNKKHQSLVGFKQTWEPIFFFRHAESNKRIGMFDSAWGGDLHSFDCHVAAVPQSNFNDVDCKQHPAQKPLSVMRWLVSATTEINDLICDPFSGSGTTGIAAAQLNRRFHGIEINDDYRALAERRLATYGQQF